MFNSLTYKDINIISYPTEIRNDNYKRNKIEFNYCLLLQKKDKKNSLKSSDVMNLNSNNPSLSNFDEFSHVGEMFLQNMNESGEESNNRKMKFLNSLDWIKDLSKKISKFLTTLELKYSLISDPERREDLFEILNKLFHRIESGRKFSFIFKEDIFSFDFIKV